MTPRRFDPDVVERRLADIRLAVRRLDELGQIEVEHLNGDWRLRATVERVLTVLVEAAVKLNTHVVTSVLGQAPSDYRSSFLDAARAGAIDAELADQLAPSAGLRNILVHGYEEVDLTALAAGMSMAVSMFPRYVEQVAAFTRERLAMADLEQEVDEVERPGASP